MRKKKIPKASKKRLVVFGTISVIVIIYFLFLFTYYLYGIYSRKEQEKQYNQQLVELKKEEKLLKTEIEKLQDEDYIARYAREKYSYSKDGEYILKITEEEKEDDNKESSFANYKYLVFGGSLIIVFCFIHILRKKK